MRVSDVLYWHERARIHVDWLAQRQQQKRKR